MGLPSDGEMLDVLGQLTATQEEFVADYERRKNADRRFAMYDFNPLVSYPVIRPFASEQTPRLEEDALVAPLPDLILYRLSTGIYYQMFNSYKEDFSRYFGHLFGEYTGIVLRNSVPPSTLVSEDDIRKTYPEKKGKVPDWAVVDGTKAVLIECKSTRFNRRALATGDEDAVNKSLEQVIKGLKQMDELERLQPHLAAGIGLGATIDELSGATFNQVLGRLHEQTNLVYKDSFLYAKDEQLFRSLGM
jgi:hypothetical protein